MKRSLQNPTDEQCLEAVDRIKAGASEQDLAAWLQMPVKRVKKLFRTELEKHAADAKHQVFSKIYEAATSGENLTAAIFSAKARYGWRDTGSRESALPEYWPKHKVVIRRESPLTTGH